MFYVGPHVSISSSITLAPERAAALGARGFALFTKNQRQWSSKPLTEEEIQGFKANMKKYGYTDKMVLPHDSYLINLGNPDPDKRKKSLDAFIDEAKRVHALGLTYLNFHPGSHVNATSPDTCLSLIAEGLLQTLEEVPKVRPVLEITAGQGSNMGSRLEELKTIITRCHEDERLGICIDTCHAFQAGYDLSTPEKTAAFFDLLDQMLPNRLCALHLNDAKAPMGKHLDRHESLGKGTIGLESFLYLASDERFQNIPAILETPNEALWAEEIQTLLR